MTRGRNHYGRVDSFRSRDRDVHSRLGGTIPPSLRRWPSTTPYLLTNAQKNCEKEEFNVEVGTEGGLDGLDVKGSQ